MAITVFYKASFLVFIICLAASCNVGTQNKNVSKSQDSIKNLVHTIDTAISRISPSTKKCDLGNLLRHFKNNTGFPVTIDSLYMGNIVKHDSLGTSELKFLVKKWFKDALVSDSEYVMENYYIIDSIKANHQYDQWIEAGNDLGKPTHSNVSTIEKLTLNDGTILLIWVLEYSDDADPLFNNTNIYFTVLYNNTLRETFLLGYYSSGIDPPAEGQRILSGKLTSAGKISMDLNSFQTEDMDSLKGESTHTHYEYSISNGNIVLLSEKEDKTKQVKIKN